MKITIDGKTEPIEIAESATLGETLERIRDFLRNRKRVVQSMALDGRDIPQAAQRELKGKPAGEFETLEIRSVDPADLSCRVLADIAANLAALDVTIHQAHRKIAQGEASVGLKSLQVILEFWVTVLRGLDFAAALLSVKYENVDVDGRRVSEDIGELMSVIEEMKASLDAADLVRLSDNLQYRMRPLLPRWEKVLDGVQKHLATLRDDDRS